MTRLRRLFQHRAVIVVVFLVGVVGVAAATQEQWHWLLEDDHAHTTGAVAPTLEDLDASTEALYRIAPDRRLRADLPGRGVARRPSPGPRPAPASVLAGDIAVNLAEPDGQPDRHDRHERRDVRVRLGPA